MSESVEKVKVSEVSIIVSEAAKAHFKSCLAKEDSAIGVRLSLKKSGCSGLSYVLDYIRELPSDDITIPLVDHYKLCIEKSSYPFLKGTIIDYIREGLNYKLIYKNPNQAGECGCGESFTIDSEIQ